MPKCTKCGAELNEDSRFCPECGNKVEPADTSEAGTLSKEDIKEAEKVAEEALEDIPDIKKIDGIDVPDASDNKYKIPDSVKKAVKQINDSKPAEDAPEPADTAEEAQKPSEKPAAADAPAKDGKKNIFPVVLAALVLAGIAIGVYLATDSSGQPVETAAVPIETTSVDIETIASAVTTVQTAETTTVTTTVQTTSAQTTVLAESSVSDDSETSETGPVLMRTTIEPADHEQVMGTGISCTVTLSEALITPDMLSDTSTFTAEYSTGTGDSPAAVQAAAMPMAPVGLILRIGSDEISVPAFSYDETAVVFRCDAVRAYVEESGHSFDEINELSFTSAGMPVDVSKVIIE